MENLGEGRVALSCKRGEEGTYLSHAFNKIWLQNGYQGEGEQWMLYNCNNGEVAFALEALGGEKGKFLSHAFSKIWLQDGNQGAGERWRLS